MKNLLFQSTEGLADGVNTFRLGDKWAKALKRGSAIRLQQVGEKRNKTIGTAQVKEVMSGKLLECLIADATTNYEVRHHLGICADDPEAIQFLYDCLCHIYGKKLSLDDEVTVIKFASVIMH